ncbi:MAG: amidohydrolase family protein [Thermoguttaceae bacterium]
MMNLRARYVFPVAGPPIADGVVTLRGSRITAVGRQRLSGDCRDLGNVAILPGLVNAHAHLDLSDLPVPLGAPPVDFVDWIKRVMAHRRTVGEGRGRALSLGLRESVGHGTTAIGDMAQPAGTGPFFGQMKLGWPRVVDRKHGPVPFKVAWNAAPVDGTVFLEIIAPTPERVAAACELALRHQQSACRSAPWRPGLAPHAPYSVHPELLRRMVALSADFGLPLALHLAESREELELLRSCTGPLRGLLEDLGAWHPELLPAPARPLDYLRRLAQAHRALIVHGNYLDEEEIAFVAAQRGQMAVVYCPRTHAWFGHRRYPLEELLAAGAVVALGTDSRASSPDLSMLAEMRQVHDKHASVPGNVVLELATIRAAAALGRAHEIGSLEPGKYADLAVVALADGEPSDPHELLLAGDGPVVARYFRGRPCAA